METNIYRLAFKTQLHLGRETGAAQAGNFGLEKTETYITADTIFSAICQTWTTFYDAASLTNFIKPYIEESDTLPFMLTSAFPFAHDVYLFPKPLNFTASSKKSTHVEFISRSVFEDIINGNPPDFDEDSLINSEKMWISPNEKDQLNRAMDRTPIVWETTTRPRVTIGAQNSASDIWHVETVQFNTNCGLWFAVKFDSDETKQKIESLLRVLGDCGIGGERNAGYGQFQLASAELEIPTAEDSEQFLTLSPICPKSSAQLEQILSGGTISYTLTPCAGWVSSMEIDSNHPRKHINMFAEGSVLHKSHEQIGRLIDLTPDNWVHPVYRYGYAWQVGIKL